MEFTHLTLTRISTIVNHFYLTPSEKFEYFSFLEASKHAQLVLYLINRKG
jgi:hypothetical protein